MNIRNVGYIIAVTGALTLGVSGCRVSNQDQPHLGYQNVAIITVNGLKFKDLNRNGQLDPYEDWRLDSLTRTKNLASLMTVEEKAGLMMHGTLPLVNDRVDFPTLEKEIVGSSVNTFITRMSGNPGHISQDNNQIQAVAEKTRLGIPVTISTDPRNHFTHDPNATSVAAGRFSAWPETLGFAALDDTDLMRKFGDIARQEYRAVGIHMSLSPQADLATEPRWGRINGTFGEDNQLAKRLTQAYIEGFQKGGSGLNKESVITVVKHFAGGGPQLNGLDPHNSYGKEQIYPGNNLEYHLVPFEGAFAANVASVMPYYGKPVGLRDKNERIESVGFGFSKQILTDMLRGRFAFKGVILSDWGILEDCTGQCQTGLTDAQVSAGVSAFSMPFGMPWGVENLTRQQRIVKSVEAGVDQFGGTSNSSDLIAAIHQQQIPQARIDQSVVRLLQQKFIIGLFEDPYVDEKAAVRIVGNADFQHQAEEAQRRSNVLLQNNDNLLPMSLAGKKAWLYQVNPGIAANYGLTVVETPEQADIAILRFVAPGQTDPHFPFGSIHFGQLGFGDAASIVLDEKAGVYSGSEDYQALERVSQQQIPTLVSVYLGRPAILSNVVDKTDVLLANFGSSDEAMFEVISGKAKPEGKLPFELPSSWQEVLNQQEDRPHDTANPLFPIRAGLVM